MTKLAISIYFLTKNFAYDFVILKWICCLLSSEDRIMTVYQLLKIKHHGIITLFSLYGWMQSFFF